MRNQVFLLALLSLALASSSACGGGKASSTTTASNTVQTPPSPQLVITTKQTLPGALQAHPYSTMLSASGGSGALHWAVTSPSFTSNTGLSLDTTGLLSGSPVFNGSTSFNVQVSDSSSPPLATTGTFFLTSFGLLQGTPPSPVTISEFQNVFFSLQVQGGIPPLSYSVAAGSLPPGVGIHHDTGGTTGGPYSTGTYSATIAVQDSYSPPERILIPISITVVPATLSVSDSSLPPRLPLNRPFSGMALARGGTKPYAFSVINGTLPTGLGAIDPITGKISGTPSVAGFYNFNIKVTDSSSPVQTALSFPNGVTVAAPLGRNDTSAAATRLGNGGFPASISPYIDPPNGAPTAADGDYYKAIGLPGTIVHVQTLAHVFNRDNPLDTVIEIVDANGVRLNTCRLPGDTSTTFASPCLNDDISSSPHNTDSSLDLQVPANANPALIFLVHVIDWRGDARPDMTYDFQLSGVVEPLSVGNISGLIGNVGGQFNVQLTANGGMTPFTWSLASGTLPPGLNLGSNGAISGLPTTSGTYLFTVQVIDGVNQTATGQFSIQVF